MMTPQLRTRQICFFFIAFLPVSKIFLLPSITAGFAKEDMWICSILNAVIDLITVCFILRACKCANTNFFGLLERTFGKKISKIILGFYVLVFLAKCFMPIQEQKDFVKLTLYITMPTDIYFLPFFIVTFYLALKPVRALGRVSDVAWAFTLIGFITILALAVNNVDYSAILPVGAQGVKAVTSGSCSSFNYYGDCVYLLFFIGEFVWEKKSAVKILVSYISACLLVTVFMIFFWGVFTSIAFRQTFALTEISKYTMIINDSVRLDYFAIILMLFSNVFALSLPAFFATQCLTRIFPKVKNWVFALSITVFLLLFTSLSNQITYSIFTFLQRYFSLVFFFFCNLLPIILSVVFYKKSQNKRLRPCNEKPIKENINESLQA